MNQVLNFVNGELTPTKNFSIKRDHFTNNELFQLCQSEPLDLIKCIQPTQKAFAEWKNSTVDQRLDFLSAFQSKLLEKKNLILKAVACDLALPITFIAAADFQIALEKLELHRQELQNHKSSPEVSSNASPTFYSAVGPMGFVLSSNLPIRLFVENVMSAVLAGNSAVVKCSSISAGFINAMVQLFAELTSEQKVIKGLVQFVSGDQVAFKNFFVTHPGLKALTVMGSNETLQNVHRQVASTFGQQSKKLKFLGGSKNLSIVLSEPADAIEHEVFETFMRGQGQLHWNSSRLFILEKHLRHWLDFIGSQLADLHPAESVEDHSLWTPVFKAASRYQEISQQAKADQAKLITVSSEAPKGFLKPIFTQDMSNCSALQQDQVHAPLFIISSVKYPFDIPKYANVSYYGDTANIWTEPDKGQKVIGELDVANISMNKWSIFSKNQRPGVKQSSYGNTDHRIFGVFNSNAKSLT